MRQEDQVVDAPIGKLIEVYEEFLPEVSFPTVDAGILTGLAAELQRADAVVQDLEAQLLSAKSERAELRASLLEKSQSALAYARVYASDNEGLSEVLAAISLTKTKNERSTTKRAPRRKTKTKQSELPMVTAEPPAGSEAGDSPPDESTDGSTEAGLH